MHASPPGKGGQRPSACISSRITTVIQVGEERATKGTITDLMSHSQFHCTGRAYLDMHGLIFETRSVSSLLGFFELVAIDTMCLVGPGSRALIVPLHAVWPSCLMGRLPIGSQEKETGVKKKKITTRCI